MNSTGNTLTEEISDVETKRTRVADRREVIRDLVRLARVDELALREDDELVEEGDDVAARLMDREDDRAYRASQTCVERAC